MDCALVPGASTTRKRPRLSRAHYTVACVCPMYVELAPLRAMLDTIHDDLPAQRDHNAYVLGELGKHNVVIAVLPSIGNNDSGIAATQILNDFPSIRFVLLVGIGGGVPGNQKTDDVRLGDVVVSQPTDTTGGVIQFDRGKRHCGAFERTGCLSKPPTFLRASVENLKAQHEQEGNQIRKLVSDMLKRNPTMCPMYSFPSQERDQLFESEYQHVGGETCQNCDITRARRREERAEDLVNVHYGTIGSSNSVIRNAMERDNLKQAYNILCVEMEAAGLMDAFPCLVIRGICDYADSHKNKKWQPFAAAVAAAYAKELLLVIPPLKQPITPVLTTSSPGRYGKPCLLSLAVGIPSSDPFCETGTVVECPKLVPPYN
jgi:nucleoside phosphorylase